MKFVMTLAATLIAAGALMAADSKLEGKVKEGSCCDKAQKAGKECAHKCCVEAAKEKKVCAKCNKAD